MSSWTLGSSSRLWCSRHVTCDSVCVCAPERVMCSSPAWMIYYTAGRVWWGHMCNTAARRSTPFSAAVSLAHQDVFKCSQTSVSCFSKQDKKLYSSFCPRWGGGVKVGVQVGGPSARWRQHVDGSVSPNQQPCFWWVGHVVKHEPEHWHIQ